MMHGSGGGSQPPEATPRGAKQRLAGALSALQYRDFRMLWFGTLGNSGTMWMEIVIRSWLVWTLTGSYVGVATVNIVRLLPSMVLAIPAGVLVDRVDRRKVLIGAQTAILGLYSLLALLALTDLLSIWAIYGVFFLLGGTSAFTQPARQSLIPMIVPQEGITNAVALQQAGFNGTRIFGPALAGVIMASSLGASAGFLLLASLAAIVVVTSVLLRIPAMTSSPQSSPFAAAREGLSYVARMPLLRALLILTFLVMLLGLPFSSLLPGYVDEVFNAGAGGFGLLMTFSGIGAFVATLVVASASFRRPGRVVVLAVIGFSVTLIGFFYVPFFAVIAVLMVAGGFAGGIHMTLTNGMMLTQSDPAYHGRIMSLNMLNHGFMPIGAYPAAALAGVVGAPNTIAIMGAALLAAVIVLVLVHPSVFRIRIDPAAAPAAAQGRPVPAGGSRD